MVSIDGATIDLTAVIVPIAATIVGWLLSVFAAFWAGNSKRRYEKQAAAAKAYRALRLMRHDLVLTMAKGAVDDDIDATYDPAAAARTLFEPESLAKLEEPGQAALEVLAAHQLSLAVRAAKSMAIVRTVNAGLIEQPRDTPDARAAARDAVMAAHVSLMDSVLEQLWRAVHPFWSCDRRRMPPLPSLSDEASRVRKARLKEREDYEARVRATNLEALELMRQAARAGALRR